MISVYIPVWNRIPNRLIRYEDRKFTTRIGETGIETVAIFKDKRMNIQEMTAYIKWDEHSCLL